MKRLFATLRECLKLQHVPRNKRVRWTPFGRARLYTGVHPLDDSEPEYYMGYWLFLPVYNYDFHDMSMMEVCWARGIVRWHGKTGFSFDWMPLRYIP